MYEHSFLDIWVSCYSLSIRKLTTTLCLTIAVLLGSAGEGWKPASAGAVAGNIDAIHVAPVVVV